MTRLLFDKEIEISPKTQRIWGRGNDWTGVDMLCITHQITLGSSDILNSLNLK